MNPPVGQLVAYYVANKNQLNAEQIAHVQQKQCYYYIYMTKL
jgi:hypothetical protein